MLLDIYYYFAGAPKKPPGYYARYKYLITLSRYELVEASLPVFIAAGISGSASGIIDVISEEKEDVEIALTLIYALTMYFVGKVLTYYLLKDEANNSQSQLYTFLRKYKFEKLARHSLLELSGFAWREFFILLCLKEIYLLDGFGAAVGAWLLIVGVALLFIRASSILQRRMFRFDNAFNQKLLCFDTGSFALSIAYILMVLICLGAYLIGVGFVPDDNVIFEWNEDFEDDSPDSMFVGTGFTFIFTSLVVGIVTLFQIDDEMPEDISDEICVAIPEPPEVTAAYLSNPQFGFERQSRESRASNNTADQPGGRGITGSFNRDIVVNPLTSSQSPQQPQPNQSNYRTNAGNFELDNVALSTPSASTVTATRGPHPCYQALCDPDSAANCVYMWNEFLGYLAGVSVYILVLVICSFDFRYKVVPALLVALIATYNGPVLLARLRITAEEALAKKNGEALYGEPAAVGNIASSTSNANDTNANGTNNQGDREATGSQGNACMRWCSALVQSYREMNLKRKGVMMVAVRLTVGWVWETVLVYLYDLMEGNEDLEPYQKVLVEVSFATVIVSIVLCVHLYVRDWAEEGGEEETQRLQVAVQEIRESAMEPTVATA